MMRSLGLYVVLLVTIAAADLEHTSLQECTHEASKGQQLLQVKTMDKDHDDPEKNQTIAENEPILGGEEKLDTDKEEVKHCIELFHRTVKEKCGKDFPIEVTKATIQIIDGTAVHMEALVGEKKTHHKAECDFEVPPSPDAQLLQKPLPEEEDGFVATLNMKGDLCKADEEDEKEDDEEALLQDDEHEDEEEDWEEHEEEHEEDDEEEDDEEDGEEDDEEDD
eukprot:gnl/TRDRNA2_/TRDRNA2_166791_c1_seq2.p1 gnl/TRDRNA2_/TRDRNA2_166791_c1~~gnl/TRDRNA2_/TRDRNA2_166791_c1_seq2.p1  ORF type:complete len:222 (-),score=92.72 gnl/TRDRNA2_/TRDRNA2_166791_c1_seq2:33-698(-)